MDNQHTGPMMVEISANNLSTSSSSRSLNSQTKKKQTGDLKRRPSEISKSNSNCDNDDDFDDDYQAKSKKVRYSLRVSRPISGTTVNDNTTAITEQQKQQTSSQEKNGSISMKKTTSTTTSLPNNRNEEKIIIYNMNDYLAVRNEENGFFLCRTKQNVFRTSHKIKILWYNNDENTDTFRPDFLDKIDFECILTNVTVERSKEKNVVKMPSAEKTRVLNILERAINVEKGINAPPDPRKLLSDGLDISILGKVDEEDVLSKINHCNSESEITEKITNGRKSVKKAVEKAVETPVKSLVKKPVESQTKKTIETPVKKPVETPVKKSIETPAKKTETPTKKVENIEKRMPTAIIGSPTPLKSEDEDFDDERDVMFEMKTPQPSISWQVDSKLLIQAVILADHDSLEAKIRDSKFLKTDMYRSVAIKKNAIHYAIEKRDWKCLELLHQIHGAGPSSILFSEPFVSELQHCELLMDMKSVQEKQPVQPFPLDNSYARFALKNGISYQSMLKLAQFLTNGMEAFYENFDLILKQGEFHTALALFQASSSSDHIDRKHERNVHLAYRFIMDQKNSPELIHRSCHRLESRMLPLHLAAIHPDPHLFLTLLALDPGRIYEPDIDGWMPIHFASVSQTFFILQHLLDIGVSPRMADRYGNTVLHLATKMSRLHNVALIIRYELKQSRNSPLFSTYNEKGLTAFHVACQKGHLDIVTLFIQNGVVQLDFATATQAGELTPLMLAARQGWFNIVKELIANGAHINATDRKNRTALTHAVMNGHSKIVDYFLKLGANPGCKDSFGNTLYHYALAYGWYHCYEILLKSANITIKDLNVFGLTAVYAAYVKGHIGFLPLMLQNKTLNANFLANDSGINLIMLLFQTNITHKSIELLKTLVEKYKCDLSRTDFEGNNALHHLLKLVKDTVDYSDAQLCDINEALSILLNHGCDPFGVNQAGISPIDFSLRNQCLFPFFRFFKQHYKTSRFQKILAGSDHFWPLLVSNYYRMLPEKKSVTFGEYVINVSGQDKGLANILQTSALKTMANGDLPIEFFIKSCRFVPVPERRDFITDQDDGDEQNDGQQMNFLDFLIQFYDPKLLEDISIINLVARYGFGWILERFTDVLTSIDEPDESGLTPLATALIHNNISTVRKLLTLKASVRFRIEKLPAFLYHLKNSRILLPDLFLTAGVDVLQTDDLGNTALHLMWEMTTPENLNNRNMAESTKILLKNGVNADARNIHGQTAFHVACKSAFPSRELQNFFSQLMKIDSFRPDSLDHRGYNALNYMLLRGEQSVEILETLLKKFSLQSLADRRRRNMLHYSAQSGLIDSVLFLVQRADPDALCAVDQDGHTPLSLAISNGHKDCTLALLKCPAIAQGFRHEIFHQDGRIKLNLLSEMYRRGWEEAIYLLEAAAIEKDRLGQFVHHLLESQCLNYAQRLLRTNHILRDQPKTFLLTYAKHIKENKECAFLDVFDPKRVETMAAELLFSALCWWNYSLYDYLMNKLSKTDPKMYENPDLLPKCFQNMVYEDADIPTFIRTIIQTMVECPPNSTLNLLSRYPIIETVEAAVRYRFLLRNSDPARWPNIQYSPLIVAVIRKRYNDVIWFLSLNRLDVNFPDSQGRTALMHAIMNHDKEMISILMGRNLCFGKTPETSTTLWLVNRKINLLARDSKGLTAFHYLIQPFRHGTFQDAEKVYAALWEILESSKKTTNLQKELHQYAKDSGNEHVVGRKTPFEPETAEEEPQIEPNRFRTAFEQFKTDGQINGNCTMDKPNLSPTKTIPDKASGIPLNVTFTKLDFQNGDLVRYNFYKLEVLAVGQKYCLSIRWGHVGTVGNQRRLFYQSEEDAVENFKIIFADKCGENWTQVHHLVSPQDGRLISSSSTSESITSGCNLAGLAAKFNNSQCNVDQEYLKDLILPSLVELRLLANNQTFEGLDAKSLDQCSFALNRLSKLIACHDLLKAKNRKSDAKLLYDMIDLSERFYLHIKIFGTKFDQLKPILTCQDLEEKSRLVKKLKTIVCSVEFLYFITTVDRTTTNPWDGLISYFKWNIKPLDDDLECNLIKSYLNLTNDYDHLNVFRLDSSGNPFPVTGKNRHLLWYRLERQELLEFFVNGFESQPEVIRLSTQSIIVNGVHFSNNFCCKRASFAVLCEVPIEKTIEIFSDQLHHQQFDTDGYSSFENKDCLVIDPARTADEKARYLFWKGCTVPIPTCRLTKYIHLQVTKQIIPRYLVEFQVNKLNLMSDS